jgi:hypothetical protein
VEQVTKPYVHSNYERKADDDYKTVDPRCVRALIDKVYISRQSRIVDCCSLNGSAIIDELRNLDYIAFGAIEAFSYPEADWIVTNPPYKRDVVDEILWHQVYRVSLGDVEGFAALLRNNFDFAKSRYSMFTDPNYCGQIHMMFRPWWSEEKKHQPIHNYVWHIWGKRVSEEPFVRYWREE